MKLKLMYKVRYMWDGNRHTLNVPADTLTEVENSMFKYFTIRVKEMKKTVPYAFDKIEAAGNVLVKK